MKEKGRMKEKENIARKGKEVGRKIRGKELVKVTGRNFGVRRKLFVVTQNTWEGNWRKEKTDRFPSES